MLCYNNPDVLPELPFFPKPTTATQASAPITPTTDGVGPEKTQVSQ